MQKPIMAERYFDPSLYLETIERDAG